MVHFTWYTKCHKGAEKLNYSIPLDHENMAKLKPPDVFPLSPKKQQLAARLDKHPDLILSLILKTLQKNYQQLNAQGA